VSGTFSAKHPSGRCAGKGTGHLFPDQSQALRAVASIAHGSATTTYDVDFVYSRKPENLPRLVDVFQGIDPYLRGAPKGLPFCWDLGTIQSGLNFTLTTTEGDIDLLREVAGGGNDEQLIGHCETMQLFGHPINVVTLPTLIHPKRSAGRPKDLIAVAELEVLQQERTPKP